MCLRKQSGVTMALRVGKMDEDLKLYLLLDDVLKNDYTDLEVFSRRQESLAKFLSEASTIDRDSAKDYILMLLGTAAVDDVDANLYIEFIDDIESGKRPSPPELKNAENRHSNLFIDTFKSSDSHFSSGMTWINDFLTPRAAGDFLTPRGTGDFLTPRGAGDFLSPRAGANLATLMLNGKDSASKHSLLESIAATTKFCKILTVLAQRPANQAFAAVVKPFKPAKELKGLVKMIARRQRTACQGAIAQLKLAESAKRRKVTALADALKTLQLKNTVANKAFGLNKLFRPKVVRGETFSRGEAISRVEFSGLDISMTPVPFKISTDIFLQEKRKQAACKVFVFKCRLSVEQLALWRWVLQVRESQERMKNLEQGLRLIKGLAKRTRKFAALTLWNSLLPHPSRFTSYMHTPDRTLRSDLSNMRSSAYQIYLSRLNKLNILTTFVMSVRCSVEQIGLWKWKIAITLQKRRQIIRILKICAKSAVKSRGIAAIDRWKRMTVKGARVLPRIIAKANLRWFYVKKPLFAIFSMGSGASPTHRGNGSMWRALVRLG